MTKEQLQALGLNDTQIAEVFKLNGQAITKEQQKIATLDQQLTDQKQLLTDANAKIESFKDLDIDTIKAEAKQYKEALELAKVENEKKIYAIQYETTLNEYLQGHNFASERIKNSIKNDIKSKEFKLDDGKLLGADEYMTLLKEKEPESFAVVDSEEKPNFLRPSGANIPKGNDVKPQTIMELARGASIRK